MPAGKFSNAEVAPVRAAIYDSIARRAKEHALIHDALVHYAAFMGECARDCAAAHVSEFLPRARLAASLAKEYC